MCYVLYLPYHLIIDIKLFLYAECTPLFNLESIEQMNLSYRLIIVLTQVVVLKTVLHVQIDNVESAYIFVILPKTTIGILLDVLFAITNYQLLCVLIVSIASILISHTLILLVHR